MEDLYQCLEVALCGLVCCVARYCGCLYRCESFLLQVKVLDAVRSGFGRRSTPAAIHQYGRPYLFRNPRCTPAPRLLQRSSALKEHKQLRALDMIKSIVTRMSDLIDNILDFARGRLGGGIALSRDASRPLEPVLEQVVDELQTASPKRTIEASFRSSNLSTAIDPASDNSFQTWSAMRLSMERRTSRCWSVRPRKMASSSSGSLMPEIPYRWRRWKSSLNHSSGATSATAAKAGARSPYCFPDRSGTQRQDRRDLHRKANEVRL